MFAALVDFAIAFVVLLVMMVVLRHRARPARLLVRAAASSLLVVVTALGGRAVAVGAEREVPRRALRDPVPDAVLDVRDAGRLSERPGAAGFSASSTG